jgi:arabinofuranosyltransferase
VSAAAARPCPWPAVEHSFAGSDAPTSWLLDGWGDPEPWGTWTLGPVARLVPDIHTLPDSGLTLTILARPFVTPAHPAVEVSVEVNGTPVGHLGFALGQPDGPQAVFMPRAVLERRMPPEIRLTIADPVSPLALGISSDDRLLGLGLRRLRLEPGE